MSTSKLIKQLCDERGISISALARKIGQSPQNFSKKLKRETVTTEELIEIGIQLGAVFEQAYFLDNGKVIRLNCENLQTIENFYEETQIQHTRS